MDAVLATINTADGATFAAADRTALITHFNNGGRGLVMFHLANDYWNGCNRLPGSPAAPCVPAGYGAAVDNRAFIDAEYNRSFVYSQYSGYLRRDGDIDGFIFWLNQVSAAPPRNVAKQHGDGLRLYYFSGVSVPLRQQGPAQQRRVHSVGRTGIPACPDL